MKQETIAHLFQLHFYGASQENLRIRKQFNLNIRKNLICIINMINVPLSTNLKTRPTRCVFVFSEKDSKSN